MKLSLAGDPLLFLVEGKRVIRSVRPLNRLDAPTEALLGL